MAFFITPAAAGFFVGPEARFPCFFCKVVRMTSLALATSACSGPGIGVPPGNHLSLLGFWNWYSTAPACEPLVRMAPLTFQAPAFASNVGRVDIALPLHTWSLRKVSTSPLRRKL